MSIYDVFSGGNRPFDKEEWAAAKQAQRKEAYELIDNTCSEMVASGDSFRQYLDVQGRFDRYSVANAILVSAQMPEATQLKEYSKGLSEEVLFVSMAKEVSAAVYDFKHNESRDASDFKSFCVAYMVSSRYGVDTRGFDFSRLPREYAEMDTQAFKGELGTMSDVLGEIQSDMYKSMEKNKPAKNKEQER